MQLTEDLLLRISITISLVVDYNAEVDDDDDHVKVMAMVSVCLLHGKGGYARTSGTE